MDLLTTAFVSECLRFDITPKGQQVHIACGPKEVESSRHPCFRLESPEALTKLQQKVWEHYQRADASAPRMADKPGAKNSGEEDFLFFVFRSSRYKVSFKGVG